MKTLYTHQATSSTLELPAFIAGKTLTVVPPQGGKLLFRVDPATEMAAARDVNSLVLQGNNGGVIVVKDFFAVGDFGLPGIILPDGTEVDSASLLFMLDEDMDVSAAAGPEGTQQAWELPSFGIAPAESGTSTALLHSDIFSLPPSLGNMGAEGVVVLSVFVFVACSVRFWARLRALMAGA